ncbi:TIM-barrel domain-containing protein [Tenacibaculum sp. IB213877]|uniref:TIM-barrel domain-containing protein n=1 Tax=Tenacibaculum sp. IB213877 TaxID=3097351 RepID=UPI002A5A20D4|nr:TIM-barrel domain-containing protein [Tenacibaculum sp. IB213877]MDY0779491.1 glycoside hydrolase family 31 protein [Tenacibaculum sp. IB213877]
MRNLLFILFSFFLATTINSQVTFVVNELPDNHNFEDSIYISGEFEGWTGGTDAYKLKKVDKTYTITVPFKEETTLFKFTLGNWQTVERDKNGAQIDNRVYKKTKEKDTVFVKIASWQGEDVANKSSAAKNVSVISETFKIPQLNRERRVWVYLPPNYETANRSFPVIYMHDGQNIFDKSTSFSGEWEVDETLNKLFRDKNMSFIVVGIDNGGDKRLDEYSPWKHSKYGGGEGEAYMEFIVKTLKPYIDTKYKTQTDKNSTAIIGSSMGGLISHYAALKYPNVFGKIGVFSPAFWFAPEVNAFSKEKGNIQDTKMYFLAGGKEGTNTSRQEISQTVKDMNSMITILKAQQFPAKNIQSKVVPEGQHNEELWRTNYEEAILWLFPEEVKKREFISAEFIDNQFVEVKVSDGVYKITPYASKIIETTFIPNGETFKNTSHAVVLEPNAISSTFTNKVDKATLKTSGLTVTIQKEPFQISYSYKGKPITSERNGYQKNDDFETIQFSVTEDEVLYGGGARALDMNRRGNRLRLYNRAHYGYETHSELMNFTLPIVASSKKYMIHFDNAPIGYLDLDSRKDNTLTYETISGRKTYQVIVGDSWLDLIDNYTYLTGKQPMPPRWALGNFSSRFGYHSQEETEHTIQKFKEENIPVDAIILDLYWFGKGIKKTMGNLEVFKDSFPDFEGMVQRLKDKGVKTVTITEPFVLSSSKRWQEAVDKDVLAKDSIGNPARYDFFFGNTGIIDIYKPEAKEWFWGIYKDLANKGVTGIWGDLGEPEVHPSWVQHHTGAANEVHNTYGHEWAKLVYEGYKKDFPETRPFILMRAGYSGSQRFGFIPWSGDVNRTWGGLQSQPEIALQMGMQGLAYMHSDLGGFAGANLDDELYVRWLQYGVFQPIYRPHAQEEVPSEPVFRAEKAKQLAKEAIELRYQLLPYNYTLAFENNQTGAPLMRPLFFEDEKLVEKSSSYLWGNDFLVAPILEAGVTKKEVIFPENSTWFDFYSDEKFAGGQTKSVTVKENSIPTFVRAGAFIPIAKLVQTTDEYSASTFDVHYYHDTSVSKSTGKLYNDDGLTADAFEKGQFELLKFEAETSKKCIEIDFTAQTGAKYKTETKNINVIVHNVQKQPKKVKFGKKTLDFAWSEKDNKLFIPIQWNTYKKKQLTIKF